MKKRVPIDLLLQWAYRDELMKNPHLLPEYALKNVYGNLPEKVRIKSCFGSLLKFGKYGCIIEEGHRGDSPWLPEIHGAPHMDALKLDAAVIALDIWSINWEESKEYLHCFGLMAEDTYALVHNRPRVGSLIAVHASLRNTPDNGAEIPKPKWVVSGKRNILVIPPKGRREYPDTAHCPLVYEPRPDRVALERLHYAAWHSALSWLADELHDKLDDHIPLSPASPARPWLSEKKTEKRIIQSLCAAE